jgi:hypothetical protein
MIELKDLINKDIWDQTLGIMILEAMDEDGDFYKSVNRMYLRYIAFKENTDKAKIGEGMDDALTDITGYCFKSYEAACRTDRRIGYHERGAAGGAEDVE